MANRRAPLSQYNILAQIVSNAHCEKTQDIIESHRGNRLNRTTKINCPFPFTPNLHLSNDTWKKKLLCCTVIRIFHKHRRPVDWNVTYFSSQPITLVGKPSFLNAAGVFSRGWTAHFCYHSEKQNKLFAEESVLTTPLFMSSLCRLASPSSKSIVIVY